MNHHSTDGSRVYFQFVKNSCLNKQVGLIFFMITKKNKTSSGIVSSFEKQSQSYNNTKTA